ncbi:MAG: hypothetical protein KTR24_04950, partial [Saprospiraceae bacterium]|nr:hypothetical protein [Saprospiraceae bacterium]
FQYAQLSFRIGEGSAQPGGLPYIWLLKSLIFFGFFLLFLQGLANICRAIIRLRQGAENSSTQEYSH